ncbi:hypothetical protein O3P69_013103 [Scylla paramamosain]|uniref:C-type lectin domain-containing protein n=1 Tax=Scylla paramamosain TaxID=85552 RepID=A0AAW0U1S4_SCYPA
MALLGVVVSMENGSRTFAKRIHAEKLHGEHSTKKALSESSDTPVRNKTFIRYDVPANYDEAHRACKEMQGRLALPQNKEEDGQIRKVVGVGFSKYPFAMSPRYWLGADDRQNEGNWVDCSTGQPLQFFNFHQTQP